MPKAKFPKQIQTANGSTLAVDKDSLEGCYLSWTVGSGYMYGVQENTPELRNFLRTVLRHLNNDKNRKRQETPQASMKATKQSIRIHPAPQIAASLQEALKNK